MQTYGSKKEKHHFYNYLTSLVKALEHKHTVIDLRNESSVSGLIKHVDGLMNVEMENVIFYDQRGREHQFQDFFINARNIRYVHIPDGLNAVDLLKVQMTKIRIQPREPKPVTFKNKRAQRYNAEIVKGLGEAQPGSSKM